MRFWDWDAQRWEARAARFAPANVLSVYIPPEDADYPNIVKRAHEEAGVLFAGKTAYAMRQASGRRTLLATAKGRFDPLIKRLDPDKRSSFVEMA